MSALNNFLVPFNSIGWFIPPYINLHFLRRLLQSINEKGNAFSQKNLEEWLSFAYSPENLAAMITERYPQTPFISNYKTIIAESTEAHFFGLHHVAASGLIPVIEGAGKKIADSQFVKYENINQVFINLASHCKSYAIKNNIGAVDEILVMMDSFTNFTKNHLYINSEKYRLHDKTNRHGILHGAYSDSDYGNPINFYKSIATVDFLCFTVAITSEGSGLAPSPTQKSTRLSNYYIESFLFSKIKRENLITEN